MRLQNIRQEHIIRLYQAFVHDGFVFLVFEKLYGENVARSLSLKHKYTEYQVSSIIKQVPLPPSFTIPELILTRTSSKHMPRLSTTE